LLISHDAYESFVRGLRNHPVKLGAVVVDQADIVDDDVVDSPIFLHKVHFVVDGQIFRAVGDEPRFHHSLVRVARFACIRDDRIFIGSDAADVGSRQSACQQVGEFLSLFVTALRLVRSEAALRHFGEIESARDDFHYLGPKGVDFRFGVEARAFEHNDDLSPGFCSCSLGVAVVDPDGSHSSTQPRRLAAMMSLQARLNGPTSFHRV
jgi:hypothetical protein